MNVYGDLRSSPTDALVSRCTVFQESPQIPLLFSLEKTCLSVALQGFQGCGVNSSYNAIGRVTEVSSAEGTITYQYNEQEFLVSVTDL